MQTVLEPSRGTPIIGEHDAVVVGGGIAGVFAAVVAARQGAKTLLLERGGFLGGHLSEQLLEHSAGFFDARRSQIASGIPPKIADRPCAIEACT